MAFLNRFEGSQLPSQVLKNINIIDTPGELNHAISTRVSECM